MAENTKFAAQSLFNQLSFTNYFFTFELISVSSFKSSSFFKFNAISSLRGRRLKGKGKGVLGARREGGGKRLAGNHCFRHPAY